MQPDLLRALMPLPRTISNLWGNSTCESYRIAGGVLPIHYPAAAMAPGLPLNRPLSSTPQTDLNFKLFITTSQNPSFPLLHF